MNITIIRDKLKRASQAHNEANVEALKLQNQAWQDFGLWLLGYMEGIEHKDQYSTLKTMVDTLNKKESKP